MTAILLVSALGLLARTSSRGQILLQRVEQFEPIPQPFELMDWAGRARDLDAFILDGSALRAGFVWWTDGNPTPLVNGSTLAIASYVAPS